MEELFIFILGVVALSFIVSVFIGFVLWMLCPPKSIDDEETE